MLNEDIAMTNIHPIDAEHESANEINIITRIPHSRDGRAISVLSVRVVCVR